jgi:hypothetical protein
MDIEASEAPLTPEVNSRQWLEALLRKNCQVATLCEHQLIHSMDLNNGHDLFL